MGTHSQGRVSYLTSLSLSFPACNMEMITQLIRLSGGSNSATDRAPWLEHSGLSAINSNSHSLTCF